MNNSSVHMAERTSFDDDIRATLSHLSDKWSLLIVVSLQHGPRRFGALRRSIDGISQRMLTMTLRRLERDGIVSRAVYPKAPPHVEYALTEIGVDLLPALLLLESWATKHQQAVHASRERFDGERGVTDSTTRIIVSDD